MMHHRSIAVSTAGGAALAAVMWLMSGCINGGHDAATLGAGDFRMAADAAAAERPAESRSGVEEVQVGGMGVEAGGAPMGSTAMPAVEGPAARPSRPIRMMAASEAAEGVLDISTIPGPPRWDQGASPVRGAGAAPVTLDAKVGEINGRPIFASTFLDPLEGRLRVEARAHAGNPEAWRQAAREIIILALLEQVQSELVLAEAYASLTPMDREVGIRAFLGNLRQDIARRNEGSLELAEERLRAREGQSVEETMKRTLERQLIAMELHRRIAGRISVSSREQRDFYERNFGKFNPPGTAVFQLIRVPAGNAAAAESIAAALEAGTPFQEVARSEFNAHAGGEHRVTFSGSLEEAALFSVRELNEVAQAMEVGQTLGPVPDRGMLTWLHLARIEREGGVDFYDAQLEISMELTAARQREERARYLQRLLERGSYSNIAETSTRLLAIATERYYRGRTAE